MPRSLADKVVVITGASSGIGRAAARRFAERGARLVLAARRASELADVVALCERLGARAVAVPTDVTDVYMMGELGDVPIDVHQRIVAVNLLGTLYGMRAALAQMRRQGHGVIINTASQAGKAPYALAVSPPAVDTPLFQHSANYTGRVIKPPKPIVTADKAALAIVRCAERPKREVSVGIMPAVMGLFRTFMKPIWERVAPAMMRHEHLGKTPAADGRGNLFAPMPPAGESGGWKKLGEKAALPSLAAPTLEAG